MTRFFLLFALLAATLPAVRAQSVDEAAFEAAAKRGIDYVYNLEFERAEQEFQALARLRPHHPAAPFFLAMVDWWRILIDIDNEAYDDRFLTALDNVVDMCDSILDGNEDDLTALFFKGGSIGFKGRLLFHRDDYLAAANAGRRALPLVQSATALDPKNYDILLGSGIYNYYADVIPQEYPFLKPLMLFVPAGDRKKGLQQLRLASERATYASVEATYFLMQVYFFYEKDYGKALELARSLVRRFPNNMLFHRYLGRCHVSLGQWDEASSVFSEIIARAGRGQRGYGPVVEREAEYYLGQFHMTNRRHEEALRHYYRCDDLSRGLDKKEQSGFMVLSNLRIGMIYDLQGKRDLAKGQYRKVRDMKDFKGSHDQAAHLLREPYKE